MNSTDKMNDDDLMNKIFDHINNNEKLQAIKVLVDNKSIGLKEAKDFVEALSMGNHLDFSELDRLTERREDFESFTNKERGSIISQGNNYKALYTDNTGKKHTLTPDHELWPRFKALMGVNNHAVKEYEEHYQSTGGTINSSSKANYSTPQKSNLFIEENKSQKFIIILLVGAVIAFTMWYFFLKS